MREKGSPVCTHCGSTKSPLWRRGVHSEILCNACGLYWKHHNTYRPLSLKTAADNRLPNSFEADGGSSLMSLSKSGSSLASSASSTIASGLQSRQGQREFQGQRKQKMGQQQSLGPNSVAVRKAKNAAASGPVRTRDLPQVSLPLGTLMRRMISPEQQQQLDASMQQWSTAGEAGPPGSGIAKGALINNTPYLSTKAPGYFITPVEVLPSIKDVMARLHAPSVPDQSNEKTKFLLAKGRLLFQGDHIVIRGHDGGVYFAILSDFWMTRDGQKLCKLTWLLPKMAHALSIDGPRERIRPECFTLGPPHTRLESTDCIIDVFYSPQKHRSLISTDYTRLQHAGATLNMSGEYSAVSYPPALQASLLSQISQPPSVASSSASFGSPLRRHSAGDVGFGVMHGADPCDAKRRSKCDLHAELGAAMAGASRPTFMDSVQTHGYYPKAADFMDDVETAHLLCSML